MTKSVLRRESASKFDSKQALIPVLLLCPSVRLRGSRLIRPKVLSGSEHSRESDVFSFGIVAWEVLSREVPWKDVKIATQLAILVDRGHRPEIPSNAPAGVVKVITSCWEKLPERRPTFAQIRNLL